MTRQGKAANTDTDIFPSDGIYYEIKILFH